VVLRTGEIFSGTVLRANRDEVSIQLDSGGVMSFRSQRVERVIRRGAVIEYNAPVAAKPPGAAEGANKGPASESSRPPPSELSSFPLHAEMPDPSGDPKAGPASGTRFSDSGEGYSLTLPARFRPWDANLPLVQRAFRNAGQMANLTISLNETEESLEDIKNGIVKLLAKRSGVKLVRQSPHPVLGAKNGEGWILEVDDSSAAVSVRQVQLLTKKGRKFFVITWSASSRDFAALAKVFEASARSFRFEVKSDDAEAEKEEIPEELQAYLRKKPVGKPAAKPSEIDPNSVVPNAGRIVEKVDGRIRGAPLGQGYR